MDVKPHTLFHRLCEAINLIRPQQAVGLVTGSSAWAVHIFGSKRQRAVFVEVVGRVAFSSSKAPEFLVN